METSYLGKRMSARFVAGETLERAIAVARRINSESIQVTLDYLGENVSSLEEAAASRDAYLEALSAVCANGIQAYLSIKLTQFGMDFSSPICRDNVEQLVRAASEKGEFIRVDMESSAYTERTFELVADIHSRFPGSVGCVVQAYLYRSAKDIERLCQQGIRVRLCKGAYLEPHNVAYPRKADVDRNYLRLMNVLLVQGTSPAVATHDERIVEETKRFATLQGISPDRFEFQMLYGVRRDLQRRLVRQGYRVRVYVPFGKAWYPYFMRRLAERPANVVFLARNLLRR